VAVAGLRRHAAVLGSDAFEGRGTGTRGGERAADYIAHELAQSGVEPLGDDGYVQWVPLLAASPGSGCQLVVSSLGESRLLDLDDDYLLLTTGSQTWLPQSVPLVFVGYGIVAPEHDYNDYQDVDVRGKAVAYLEGEPAWFGEGGSGPTVHASPETKQRTALSRGAAASVLLRLPGSGARQEWARLRRDFAFDHLSLAYTTPRHLSLILHPDQVPALFKDALYDWPRVAEMHRTSTVRSFHLPVSLSFEGDFETQDLLAANVVGILRGRSRSLADTHVVVSAHYDHLGIGPEVAGDGIYNGVVDNALGVAGVLEVARVMAGAPRPPRRSVVFLLTTGEEAGALGATYFVDHPPVPLESIVAAINVDGLAFLDTFDDVIGVGGELSDLGPMLRRAVAPLGLRVSHPPVGWWSRESFLRSDQVAFAEAGIPAVLIMEGFSWSHLQPNEAIAVAARWMVEVYHTPQDDLEQRIDYRAARLHCQAVAALAEKVAEASVAPRWRPGVPYAYRRLLRLAGEGGD
jgi:hypothetical protein